MKLLPPFIKEGLEVLLGRRGPEALHAVRKGDILDLKERQDAVNAGLIEVVEEVSKPVLPEKLSDEVWHAITDDATNVATGLLDTLTGTIVENYGTLDQPIPLADRIEPIEVALDLNLPFVRNSQDSIDTLNERLLEMVLAQRELGLKMADAGIYVDPDTGEIRLEAMAHMESGFSLLQYQLDAANAEITQRVTYSTLSDELTSLVLDPSRIPDLASITGRVSDVEVVLDGLDGRFAASAITGTVTAQGVTLTQAVLDIDSLEAEVALRVTTDVFNGVEGRVTQAEVKLDTIDGGAIGQAVLDASGARQDLDDLFEKKISGLLNTRDLREKYNVDLAFAREDLTAKVVQDISAEAAKRFQLAADLETASAKLDAVYQLNTTEAGAFGQWYNKIDAAVYNSVTGLTNTHGLISAVYTLDLDASSLFGQWYNKLEGDLYDPLTGFASVSGTINEVVNLSLDPSTPLIQFYNDYNLTVYDGTTGLEAAHAGINDLNNVEATSTSALVQAHLGLVGTVSNQDTGLQQAHAAITTITDLTVEAGTAMGSFWRRTEAQIGGDGSNLVRDANISLDLYWSLSAGWSINPDTAYGTINSKGSLVYDETANAGASWGSACTSDVFPVQQLNTYTAAFQTQGNGNYKVRGRVRWLDKDKVFISNTNVSTITITAQTAVQTQDAEVTAPANAKWAQLRFHVDRTNTNAPVQIGGPAVQRIGEGLTKTRGQVNDIVNFEIDEASALFVKLTGVTTEVFGENGTSGLKATSVLQQTSIDATRAGFALKTDNNGHISGMIGTSDLIDNISAETALLFAADKMFFMGEAYAGGTVNVTKGATAVTGSGTAWNANIAANDWFTGPDGRRYQIASVNSNTSLTLKWAYLGQTDTGETYGVTPGHPLMSVYPEDTLEGGILIPKGVYIDVARIKDASIGAAHIKDASIGEAHIKVASIDEAHIKDAAINRAKITDTIESDDYTEDAKGVPTNGVKIDFANDIIKLAGPVISRNLVIASGSFQHGSSIGGNQIAGSSVDLNWVNTGVRIGDGDVWATSKRTFMATVRVSPASATNTSAISIWGGTAEVFNGFGWNGAAHWNSTTKPGMAFAWMYDPATLVDPDWASGNAQRIFLNIKAFTWTVQANPPIDIHWKLYQVT